MRKAISPAYPVTPRIATGIDMVVFLRRRIPSVVWCEARSLGQWMPVDASGCQWMRQWVVERYSRTLKREEEIVAAVHDSPMLFLDV
jgi:hypothetical protein